MSRFIWLPLALLFVIGIFNVSRAEDPVAGTQVEQTLTLKSGATISYLLYLPNDFEPGKSYPLMLFLHGRGESNGPLSLVAKWGPPLLASKGESFPFILASPQCPREDQWRSPTQQAALVELLDHLTTRFAVDKDRVMLTGLSMGGYGTWRLAADHPERFSVAVPVCGGGNPADAERLKKLPIWVFHGDQDEAVPFAKSVEMVDAIRGAGGTRLRFTSLEHVGHNSWSATYATPELYQWMLDQRASNNK